MCQTLVAKVSTSFLKTICQTPPITSSISSASWAIHQLQQLQKCYRISKAFKELKREIRVRIHNLLVTYLAKALTHYTLANKSKEGGLNLKMISIRIKKQTWEVTIRRIWQIWTQTWTIRPTRDLLQHHQTKVLDSKEVKLCKNAQEEPQAEIELGFLMLTKANQVFSIDQHLQPRNARTSKTIREIPWSSILVWGSFFSKTLCKTRTNKNFSSQKLAKML